MTAPPLRARRAPLKLARGTRAGSSTRHTSRPPAPSGAMKVAMTRARGCGALSYSCSSAQSGSRHGEPPVRGQAARCRPWSYRARGFPRSRSVADHRFAAQHRNAADLLPETVEPSAKAARGVDESQSSRNRAPRQGQAARVHLAPGLTHELQQTAPGTTEPTTIVCGMSRPRDSTLGEHNVASSARSQCRRRKFASSGQRVAALSRNTTAMRACSLPASPEQTIRPA